MCIPLAKLPHSIAIILLLFFFSSCGTNNADLDTFNNFLGEEKAEAFDQGIDVFDQFLAENFPDQSSEGERTKTFLQKLLDHPEGYGPDPKWVFNQDKCSQVFELLESSGMRKEFRLYGYEDYDFGIDSSNYITLDDEEEELIPVAGQDSAMVAAHEERLQQFIKDQKKRKDSSLSFNPRGKYIEGLVLIQQRDSRIKNYTEAVQQVGGTTLPAATTGALKAYSPEDFEDPFVKRIVFAEIFWHVLQWNEK